MQVNAGRDQVHHHGALAGLGAAAAAVIAGVVFAGVLVLAVWHHIAGQVSTAVQVIVWAFTAAVVAAAGLAVVFAFAWVRHRVLHPETLVRQPPVTAEVLQAAAPQPALELPPPVPAGELEPGRPQLWRAALRDTATGKEPT